ncbi:FAD-binding protein [Nocardia thailandica]|uniref:FAD-dependent oxidoreductase n=1 Tax=Nocardia thailandica TaxID=257275 RepID=UPI000313B0B6|nr:FAD-binding protein [Nocardia thailandica]
MSDIETDVLILGGGPAGLWAALAAATAGARVIVVDKNRCGSSGPTAFGATTLWHIAEGPARGAAVERALTHGGGLGAPEWIDRVLDESHRRVDQLAHGGHRIPRARAERIRLDGAGYLRRLRRSAVALGVDILDHHPALRLLRAGDGTVAGAAGVCRREHFRPWTIRAGAVVLATGGCAFLSGSPGTDVDTGEGLLMAAEAGADLAGMEFSNAYGFAPALPPGYRAAGPMPGLTLPAAALHDESGEPLAGRGPAALAAIAEGRRVTAALRDLPAPMRQWLARQGACDRAGRVPVRAVFEGTVRGSGGVELLGPDCATGVPGLYGAGGVAAREPVLGAVGGSSAQGGGWALASGVWAGAGAARFATARGVPDRVSPVGGAGLGAHAGIDPRSVIGLVQEHTLPLRRSYWRSAGSLRDSIAELDALWPVVRYDLGGVGAGQVRARQAAALLAVARWTKYSALERAESRGMHRRTDHPGAADDWRARLHCGGLDEVWVRRGSVLGGDLTAAYRPAV